MILISLFKKKILQILLFKMNKIIRKNNKIGVLWYAYSNCSTGSV